MHARVPGKKCRAAVPDWEFLGPARRRTTFRRITPEISLRAALAAAAVIALLAPAAIAVDVAPHRALYSMTLGSAKSSSNVVSARGTMVFEWGDTCDGWTIEQRYRLRMQYAESGDVEIASSYVSWEAKDGVR